MRLILGRTLVWVMVVAGAAGCFDGTAVAQPAATDDELLDRIIADWRARQAAVSKIRYRARGEDGMQSRFPKEVTWTLDFRNNRMRKESDEFVSQGDVRELSRQVMTYLFDGTKYQTFYGRERNTSDLYKPPPALADLNWHTGDGFIVWQDLPVFLAHGSIPTNEVSPEPSRLDVPLKKDDFVVGGRGKFQGRDCVVLKSPKIGDIGREYWVDLARQSAVLRHIILFHNRPLFGIDVAYVETKAGWLPARWTNTRYEPADNAVLLVEEMSNVTVELNPTFGSEEFHMKPTPGMRVNFEEKKGLYLMQPDGTFELLDTNAPTAVAGDWTIYYILALVALVICIVCAAAYVIRKRRQRA